MKWTAFSLLPLLLLLTVSGVGQSSKEPTKIVQEVYNMLSKFQENSPSAKAQKTKINQYWLFRDISLDAIQDQWSKMKSKERTQYLSLMQKLLEKTIYEDTGDKLKKGHAKIIRQDNLSKERAIVRSRITIKKNNLVVSNDYGLQKVGSKWKIRDIYIDGQNLAEDYRSQYNKIANQYGISGSPNSLLERIKDSISKDSGWYDLSSDDNKKKSSSKTQESPPRNTRPSLIQ